MVVSLPTQMLLLLPTGQCRCQIEPYRLHHMLLLQKPETMPQEIGFMLPWVKIGPSVSDTEFGGSVAGFPHPHRYAGTPW